MNDIMREFTTSPVYLIVGYAFGRIVQHFEHTNRRKHHDHS